MHPAGHEGFWKEKLLKRQFSWQPRSPQSVIEESYNCVTGDCEDNIPSEWQAVENRIFLISSGKAAQHGSNIPNLRWHRDSIPIMSYSYLWGKLGWSSFYWNPCLLMQWSMIWMAEKQMRQKSSWAPSQIWSSTFSAAQLVCTKSQMRCLTGKLMRETRNLGIRYRVSIHLPLPLPLPPSHTHV